MAEQRGGIKRIAVNQSSIPRSHQGSQPTQLISGNRQVISSSTTGNQGNIISSRTERNPNGFKNSTVVSHSGQEFNLPPGQDWQGIIEQMVVSGDTDFAHLKHMQNSMLELVSEFRNDRNDMKFEGAFKEKFEKRLMILEHDFDGMIRRFLNVKYMFPDSGARSLDYNNILMELQNKVDSLEIQLERARSSGERQYEVEIDCLKLENERLKDVIRQKDEKIRHLNCMLNKEWGFATGGYNDCGEYHASLCRHLEELKHKGLTMATLEHTVDNWICGLPKCGLKDKVTNGTLRCKEDDHYRSMCEKLRHAQHLYGCEMKELEMQIQKKGGNCSNVKLPTVCKVLDTMEKDNTQVRGMTSTGCVIIEKEIRIEKEVPCHDARTKHIISTFVAYIRRILKKHPVLRDDMDITIRDFMDGEMEEMVTKEDMDRLLGIVKYVPQMVRVENVYNFDSQKHRKTVFHLKILLKSLLSELLRVREESNGEIAINDGIVNLINSQLEGIVDIDTIEHLLSMYRCAPKTRDVPKIIEKVVVEHSERPNHIILENKTASVVPVKSVEVLKDCYGVRVSEEVPVEFMREKAIICQDTIEKALVYTKVRDRPINTTLEKTFAKAVPTEVEKYTERDCPIELKEMIPVTEKEIVEILVQQKEYLNLIEEKEVPVDVIVEKIVEKIIERNTEIPVNIIQEKLVKQTDYQILREDKPIEVLKHEIINQVRQKLVEAIQTRQQMIQVDRIVEKLVPIENTREIPKEVPARFEQIFVEQPQAPQIIHQKEIVPEMREVAKVVDRFIEKPLFVEHVTVERQMHEHPVVHEITKECTVPVEVMVPIIVHHDRPVEIPIEVPHFVKEQIPVYIKEENTYPVPVYEEIVRVEQEIKEKIIEKIVEVPKAVTIEKIVEKIVVVPRIVERIVEVPQIIEKIVEVRVEVPKQMPPIERIIERPCVVEVPVEVPVEKIVYIEVEKIVEVLKEVIVKGDHTHTHSEVPVEIFKDRVVVERQEVPINIIEEKIEFLTNEKIKAVPFDRVLPIEIKVPVPIEKHIPVIMEERCMQVLPVVQQIEKLVPLYEEKITHIPVEVLVENVVVEKVPEIYEVERHHVTTKYEEVQIQKSVPVKETITYEKILEVPTYHEKLVPLVKEIPRVFEFEIPKTIPLESKEIVEVVKPYIVNINKYIEKIREKIIEVPYLLREAEIQEMRDESPQIQPHRHTKQVQIHDVVVEKSLRVEVEKRAVDTVHKIEKALEIVTQVIEKDRKPVLLCHDRVVEVPVIMEKIVDKITMMPQIVEVLKHVYELSESDNITDLCGVGVGTEWIRYRQIMVTLEPEIAAFMDELTRLRAKRPAGCDLDFLQNYMLNLKTTLCEPERVTEETIISLCHEHDQCISELNKIRSFAPHQVARIELLIKYIKELVKVYFKRSSFLVECRSSIYKNGMRLGRSNEREIVRIPYEKSAEEKKEELSRVMLIDQLLSALRKIESDHKPVNLKNYLEEDVMDMFGVVFNGSINNVTESFTRNLRKFTSAICKKFDKLDGWTIEHEDMLKSFIDERFELASVVKEMKEQNKELKASNNSLMEKQMHQNYMPRNLMDLLIDFDRLTPRVLDMLRNDRNTELLNEYSNLHSRFEEYQRIYDQFITKDNFGSHFVIGKEYIEKCISSHERQMAQTIIMLQEKLRQAYTVEDGKYHYHGHEHDHNFYDPINPHASSLSADHKQCDLTISRLKEEILRLQLLLRQHNRDMKGSTHTGIGQSPRKTDTDRGGSSSDVDSYGANFGGYVNADSNEAGMINSKKEYFPSYGSSVEVAREMANSSATNRTGEYVSSSQHIRIEGSSAGSNAGGAVYGTANTLSSNNNNAASRYGNNVQITTSRITTERNADSSAGNVVSRGGNVISSSSSSRQELSGGGNVISSSTRQELSGTGAGSAGSAGKYQFYQSKYDKK